MTVDWRKYLRARDVEYKAGLKRQGRMHQLSKIRRTVPALAVALLLACGVEAAAAAITPTRDANVVAAAASSVPVTGAFESIPSGGNPAAVSDTPLTGLPTSGPSYAILSSGDSTLAANADPAEDASVVNGIETVRNANDVTILRVDLTVPATANCVSVDFRFLSEEFPVFVGGTVNDAFVAELDSSDWSSDPDTSAIIAPNNFAFDQQGNVISVNAAGAATMSAAQAAGTVFGGATPLLRASKPAAPGGHSLYLSIFDQGDFVLDSAVLVDNILASNRSPELCTPGALLRADPPPPPPPPPADADADGISDAQDTCPSRAGPASNSGCPEA